NPAGRLRGSRNRLSEAVICALLRDFSMHGEKAIAKVRRTQPAAYLKILALLVPREHKVEHSNAIKDMTTEQIERGIELIKEMIAKRRCPTNHGRPLQKSRLPMSYRKSDASVACIQIVANGGT